MKQVSIPITKADEPRSTVVLANGAVLIIRTVVMAVYQIMNDDGSPLIGSDGKYQFGLNSSTLVVVDKEPVELKEMN